MRMVIALCAIGLGLSSSGCSLIARGTSVLTNQMKACLDDYAERARNRKWAEEAWRKVRSTDQTLAASENYADGFKEGFAHYLYEGGTGEPPPLPPQRYRSLRYQSPTGYRAIEDWFAGYRHGATVADQGGYRRWVTGPSSMRWPDEPEALTGVAEAGKAADAKGQELSSRPPGSRPKGSASGVAEEESGPETRLPAEPKAVAPTGTTRVVQPRWGEVRFPFEEKPPPRKPVPGEESTVNE